MTDRIVPSNAVVHPRTMSEIARDRVGDGGHSTGMWQVGFTTEGPLDPDERNLDLLDLASLPPFLLGQPKDVHRASVFLFSQKLLK